MFLTFRTLTECFELNDVYLIRCNMKLLTILILLTSIVPKMNAQSPMVKISNVSDAKEDSMVDFFWHSKSNFGYISCGGRYYHSYRNYVKIDSTFEKNYSYLIDKKPNKKNYYQYFKLANILLDKRMFEDAKRMFLNIESSKLSTYNITYKHASDVGDGGNIYGYGSYTSNFKNKACRKLAEIYIELSKYDSALFYLTRADSMYRVYFNCGTGHYLDRGKMNGLYQYCYIHLKKYDEVVNKYFNQDYLENEEPLGIAFRHIYTEQQIKDSLNSAIRSVVFIKDTSVREYYTFEHYGDTNERKVVHTYYSGEAYFMLFGKYLKLPEPFLSHGANFSKPDFIQRFRNSCFVRELLFNN